MKTFTASRIADGQGLFPCKIIVEANKITVRIPGLFSNQDKDIPFDKISEVAVDTPLVGYSTIRFYTTGVGIVSAHGFTKSEVREIKQLIDNPSIDSSNTKSSDGEISEPYEPISNGKISYSSSISEDEWDNLRPVKRDKPVNNPPVQTEDFHVTNSEEEISPKNLSTPKLNSRLSERLKQIETKKEDNVRKSEFIARIQGVKEALEVYESEYKEDSKNPFLIKALAENLLDEKFERLKRHISEYSDVVDENIENDIMQLLDAFDEFQNLIATNDTLSELSPDVIEKSYQHNFQEKIIIIQELYQECLKGGKDLIKFKSRLLLEYEALGLMPGGVRSTIGRLRVESLNSLLLEGHKKLGGEIRDYLYL